MLGLARRVQGEVLLSSSKDVGLLGGRHPSGLPGSACTIDRKMPLLSPRSSTSAVSRKRYAVKVRAELARSRHEPPRRSTLMMSDKRCSACVSISQSVTQAGRPAAGIGREQGCRARRWFGDGAPQAASLGEISACCVLMMMMMMMSNKRANWRGRSAPGIV
jgi:hypothetical protein